MRPPFGSSRRTTAIGSADSRPASAAASGARKSSRAASAGSKTVSRREDRRRRAPRHRRRSGRRSRRPGRPRGRRPATAGRSGRRRGRGRPSRRRSRPRGASIGSPRREPLGRGVDQPLRQLLRAVGGDLVAAVADRGVVQAGEALLDVVERRRRPAPARSVGTLSVDQHPADEGFEQRVGDGVAGVLVPGEHAEVGERRLRGVQHPHLQVLERGHVVDEAARRRGPRAGVRPAKRSSITHWRNGSPPTAAASR